MAVGTTIASALFLANVGAARLPIIYLVLPVIMLVLTPVLSYLTRRIGLDRLVDAVLCVLAVGGVAFYLVLASAGAQQVRVISYVLQFYASLWYIYLYTLFWNFADEYFDILDAKRLFSVMTGGISLGGMLGGGLVVGLLPILEVADLFIVWTVLTLLTFPLLRFMRRRYRRIEAEEEEQERSGFLGQVRHMAAMCRDSRYVMTLIILSLCMLFMSTTCEFLYLGVFSDFGKASAGSPGLLGTWFPQPQNAEELAALLGKLTGVTNVFGLVVTLFLFSRVVGFLGVRNTMLIQPLVYLAVFLLFRTDGVYQAAVFGFLAYQGIQASIDLNNYNFVLNAVPSEAKKSIRTFMEGLLEPLAGSLAGLFL
ncbi:MAG: hypothetical protein AB1505_26250, partial [Candidatus Latescibacterota bacterium]